MTSVATSCTDTSHASCVQCPMSSVQLSSLDGQADDASFPVVTTTKHGVQYTHTLVRSCDLDSSTVGQTALYMSCCQLGRWVVNERHRCNVVLLLLTSTTWHCLRVTDQWASLNEVTWSLTWITVPVLQRRTRCSHQHRQHQPQQSIRYVTMATRWRQM